MADEEKSFGKKFGGVINKLPFNKLLSKAGEKVPFLAAVAPFANIIFCVLVAVILVFAVVKARPSNDNEIIAASKKPVTKVSEFKYELNQYGTVSITGMADDKYNYFYADIRFPSKIEGYPVTIITGKYNVRSVKIPDTCDTVTASFCLGPNFTELKLPSSVRYIYEPPRGKKYSAEGLCLYYGQSAAESKPIKVYLSDNIDVIPEMFDVSIHVTTYKDSFGDKQYNTQLGDGIKLSYFKFPKPAGEAVIQLDHACFRGVSILGKLDIPDYDRVIYFDSIYTMATKWKYSEIFKPETFKYTKYASLREGEKMKELIRTKLFYDGDF